MDPGRGQRDQGGSGKPYAAGAADSIIAFLEKRASAKDVGTLTLFFKSVVSQFFPDPLGSDDLTFRELLVKVVNEILLRLRDGNLSQDDLETIGFALRRVYFVAQAYKAEKQKSSLADWLQQLVGLAKSAGVPIAI